MILLLFLLLSLSEAASVPVKHVTVGENIILPCEAADSSIRVVEWTRPDLGSTEYVLLYRNGQPDPTKQQPSFKGRVQLFESEVKNGNLSLTLTNVSSSDSGTYECRAAFGGSGRNKRANIDEQPIKTIKLQVSDSDSGFNSQAGDETETPPIGSRGHAVAVAVMAAGFVLTCSVFITMFLFRKYKRRADSRSTAAADEPEAEGLA